MNHLAHLLVVFLLTAFTSRQAVAQLSAFPGAVGQGAASAGGRGGDVYRVTTLDDYGRTDKPVAGSLRHGIESAAGPRTIVFDIAGGIELARPLIITHDNLTVAGQTSPGGVTVWGYNTSVSRAHDVVIRYLRFRTGDFNAQQVNADGTPSSPPAGKGKMDLRGDSADCLSVVASDRVILDHVSTSWGMDETLSVTTSRNVTVQHSMIANSLNDSFHNKGPHGYGSLVRGELTAADRATNQGGYTFYGNLWAHHTHRNPSVGGQQNLQAGQSVDERRSTDVNLINNVVYDWGAQPTHRNNEGLVRANLIGNYYVAGPESQSGRIFNENNKAETQLYQDANWVDGD
ncbi:MAG: hypothetical protein KDB23_32080, partial [Planctomycetales bacterium]|nr:hypothetical protein [Planctomycetales bacterium]